MNAVVDITILEAGVAVAPDVSLDVAFLAEEPGKDFCPTEPFETFTGAVVSSATWSETRVSGGGTLGFAVGGIGMVHGGDVRSRVSNKTEFWLVRSDGAERRFVFDQRHAEFREGQILTMVTVPGNYADREQGYLNHSTNDYHKLGTIQKGPKHLFLAVGGLFANMMALIFLFGFLATGALPSLVIAALLLAGNVYCVKAYRLYQQFKQRTAVVVEWVQAHRIVATKPGS